MINPEEYTRYFEDLNRASNAEIGPKDFFETASKDIIAGQPHVRLLEDTGT